jgi:hypothetical protein
MDAEERGMPIYVLRSNTVNQMEQFLSDLFNLSTVQASSGEMDYVRKETQSAIQAVLNGERWVDLPPGPSLVRRFPARNGARRRVDFALVWQRAAASRENFSRVET